MGVIVSVVCFFLFVLCVTYFLFVIVVVVYAVEQIMLDLFCFFAS